MCRQIKDSLLSQSDNINKVSVNQNELKSQNDNLTGPSIKQEEQNLRKDLGQNQQDDNQLKEVLIQEKQLGNASLIYQYQYGNSNKNESMQKITENEINIENQKKEYKDLQNNIVINIQNQTNQQFSQLLNPQTSKQEIEQESRSNKQLMRIKYHLAKEVSLTEGTDKKEILECESQKNRSQQEIEKECLNYHLAKEVSLTEGTDKNEILECESQKNRSQQEIEKECLNQQNNCLDQKIKLTEIQSKIQINKQNEKFMREQTNNNNNNNQEKTQDQVQLQSVRQTPNQFCVIDSQSLIYEQQNQSLKSSFQDQKTAQVNEEQTVNKNQKQEKNMLEIEYAVNKNEISKQESFDEIKKVQNVESNEQKQIKTLQNNNLDKTNQNEQKQSQNQSSKSKQESFEKIKNVKSVQSNEQKQITTLQNYKLDKTNQNEQKQSQNQSNMIETESNQKSNYTKQYLFMSFYDGDEFICDVDISLDYSEFNESFDQDFSFFEQNSDNQNKEQKYLAEDTTQQQKQTDFQNPNNISSNQLEFQQNNANLLLLDEQNQAELANQVFTEEKDQKGNQKDGILKLEDSQQKLSINQYDGQWLDQINGLEVNQINDVSEKVKSGENQKEPDQIQEDLKKINSEEIKIPGVSFQECLIELYNRNYRISCFLKQGGFGAVFKGYQTKDQTVVAIKFSFPINNQSSEQTQQIFEDMKSERNIIDQIKCYSYIVKTFDLFIIQKSHIIVQIMEYCETDLQDYIQKRKVDNNPLSKEETIDIYFQLINALIEIHANGIVHLDIKPQNILRSCEGVYKLTDFGISQLLRQDNNSCTEQFKGLSQKYCSPEQLYSWQNQERIFDQKSNSKFNLNSEKQLQTVSMASDVFSMGLTFLFILQLNLSDEAAKQIRNGQYEFDTRQNNQDARAAQINQRDQIFKDSRQIKQDQSQLKENLIQEKQQEYADLICQQQHDQQNKNESLQKNTESELNIDNQQKENTLRKTLLDKNTNSQLQDKYMPIESYEKNSTVNKNNKQEKKMLQMKQYEENKIKISKQENFDEIRTVKKGQENKQAQLFMLQNQNIDKSNQNEIKLGLKQLKPRIKSRFKQRRKNLVKFTKLKNCQTYDSIKRRKFNSEQKQQIEKDNALNEII
ncbi:hypothetical protein ABPG74_019246 [Tetrahymena malaccensis]